MLIEIALVFSLTAFARFIFTYHAKGGVYYRMPRTWVAMFSAVLFWAWGVSEPEMTWPCLVLFVVFLLAVATGHNLAVYLRRYLWFRD
ncbi:MAG: hypothetical protein NTY66_00105 [Candidatus Vogelbacteria bacterium]|nr:hypothetical protein [Candidatus Vogelbacteria bacterium]